MAIKLDLKHPAPHSAPLGDATNKPNAGSPKKARIENPMSIPRYLIADILGEGSHGRVFKGYDRELRIHVALKQCPLWKTTKVDTEISFLKHLNQVDIPHRLHFLNSYKEGNTINIVTEYLEKPDLSKYYEDNKTLNFPEIKSLTIQFLEFLLSLNSHDIIHGDLKASNAIYSEGYLTVLDYGAMGYVKNYNNRGTPLYFSPSLLLGAPRTPSDDLWSLGCTLFELFTGEELFRPILVVSNGQYSEKLHVSLIAQKIGLPSAKYLKQCTKAHQFYRINGSSVELIDNPQRTEQNWKDQILTSRPEVSLEEKTLFIELLQGMLQYENVLTPFKLLKSPLFLTESRLRLPFNLASDRKVTYTDRATISLRTYQTSLF